MVDEEEITFAPTYRFERDTREKYVYTKAKATGVSLHSRLREHILIRYNKRKEEALTKVSFWMNSKQAHKYDQQSLEVLWSVAQLPFVKSHQLSLTSDDFNPFRQNTTFRPGATVS